MDPDLLLIIGLILATLSIPSVLSALSDRRAPRASMITILIGGGLILLALQTKTGGYSLAQLPDVFVSVLGRYMP